MVISTALARQFNNTIEFQNVSWDIVDEVAVSDPNILRPIKGVCFEEMFRKIAAKHMAGVNISLGQGDSDIDVYLNGIRLQLKTCDKGSTKVNSTVGIALHKTHGREERPYNLYSCQNKTFDFLVVLHPHDGILIVPYSKIPENQKWPKYLADPAIFEWNSVWKNRWDLLGFSSLRGINLESRSVPPQSDLPNLSKETYLEDFEIVETLCRPEYFRAAVMGLKGNIKEFWLRKHLEKEGYFIQKPTESYPKYDFTITNSKDDTFRVQVKGTSKGMCKIDNEIIGVEVMSTHGRFPNRGYKRTEFEYLAIVISESQISHTYPIQKGTPHFLFIPASELPSHYLIGKGDPSINSGYRNKKWNQPEYADVLYPVVRLKLHYDKATAKVLAVPNLSSYRSHKGIKIIDDSSRFRNAGPYILDDIPIDFE